MMKKIFINILLLASFSAAYGFEEGFIWALKANFNKQDRKVKGAFFQ